MMIAIDELITGKQREEGITVLHYEGRGKGDDFTLELRETRIFEANYLGTAMVVFLNLIAALEAEQKLKIVRLILEAMHGRDSLLLEIDGKTLVHFPDEKGGRSRDMFVSLSTGAGASRTETKATKKGTGKRREK